MIMFNHVDIHCPIIRNFIQASVVMSHESNVHISVSESVISQLKALSHECRISLRMRNECHFLASVDISFMPV